MLIKKRIGKGYYSSYYSVYKNSRGYFYIVIYRNPQNNRKRVYKSPTFETYTEARERAHETTSVISKNTYKYLSAKEDL